jgi:hypothetical protein
LFKLTKIIDRERIRAEPPSGAEVTKKRITFPLKGARNESKYKYEELKKGLKSGDWIFIVFKM